MALEHDVSHAYILFLSFIRLITQDLPLDVFIIIRKNQAFTDGPTIVTYLSSSAIIKPR